MRLLDLYCGAGGAAAGYHRAGFDVVGIDISRQLHFPFEFILGDVLDPFLTSAAFMASFDAIHASPPCQPFTPLREMSRVPSRYPDIMKETRELLESSGRPWVIENVPQAPMRADLTLCGTMFGLHSGEYQLRRHRIFEVSGFRVSQPGPCRHQGYALGVYGHGGGPRFTGRPEGLKARTGEARELMGIDWMNGAEMAQAVPPAYAEHIGRALMRSLQEAA